MKTLLDGWRALLVVTLLMAPIGLSACPPLSGNAAVKAIDRLDEGWWADRHRAILKSVATRPDPEVILIGDSITNNYDKASPPDEDFQPTWRLFYAPRHALNLGFSGDTTSNVLWRLRHGEVDGPHPKVAILLIGTNDSSVGGRDAVQTERGIDAVVVELERRLPATRILLLGILPSAVSNAKSATDAAINAHLAASYGENPRVTYLDIGAIFRRPDGQLDASIFYDPRLPQRGKPLHPDTRGQRMMAETIEPTLARMLDEAPRQPLAAMTAVNAATIPVPGFEDDSYDWFARHHAALALGSTLRPQVVMIGDSITHFWSGAPAAGRVSGPDSWKRLFADTPVLNLGFGWDRTQNLLWRLRQGEMAGLAPKWIVLNIGTNNLTGSDRARANTPEEVVSGIDAVVRDLRRRSPLSRIVVMAILPRGRHPDNPLRRAIGDTNKLLAARFARDPTVIYLDIGARYLDAHGELPPSLMPDGTHPSEAGYAIWAAALARAGLP